MGVTSFAFSIATACPSDSSERLMHTYCVSAGGTTPRSTTMPYATKSTGGTMRQKDSCSPDALSIVAARS